MKIKVTVREASGLRAADIGGTSDPYVTVHVVPQAPSAAALGAHEKEIGTLPESSIALTTPVCRKTLEPVWDSGNEAVVDLPPGHFLEFRVWDWDKLSADDYLGRGVVGPQESIGYEEGSQSVSLAGTAGMRKSRCTGRLKVSVCGVDGAGLREPRFLGMTGAAIDFGNRTAPAKLVGENLMSESADKRAAATAGDAKARDNPAACMRAICTAFGEYARGHAASIGGDQVLSFMMLKERFDEAEKIAEEMDDAVQKCPDPAYIVDIYGKMCLAADALSLFSANPHQHSMLVLIDRFTSFVKSDFSRFITGAAQAEKAAVKEEKAHKLAQKEAKRFQLKPSGACLPGWNAPKSTVAIEGRCHVSSLNSEGDFVMANADGSVSVRSRENGSEKKNVRIADADAQKWVSGDVEIEGGDWVIIQRQADHVIRAKPDGSTVWKADLKYNSQPSDVVVAGGLLFVSVFCKDKLVVLDLATGEAKPEIKDDRLESVESLVAWPDKNAFISFGDSTRLWNLSDGAHRDDEQDLLGKCEGFREPAHAAIDTANGVLAVFDLMADKIKFMDLNDGGAPIGSAKRSDDDVNVNCLIAADGNWLVQMRTVDVNVVNVYPAIYPVIAERM
jgi:C2 domain